MNKEIINHLNGLKLNFLKNKTYIIHSNNTFTIKKGKGTGNKKALTGNNSTDKITKGNNETKIIFGTKTKREAILKSIGILSNLGAINKNTIVSINNINKKKKLYIKNKGIIKLNRLVVAVMAEKKIVDNKKMEIKIKKVFLLIILSSNIKND